MKAAPTGPSLACSSPATAIDDISAAPNLGSVDATLATSPQYERVAVNYRQRETHPRQRAIASPFFSPLTHHQPIASTGEEDCI